VEAIKVGDVVALKSGGPKMTVSEVGVIKVTCNWFANGELKEANLSPQALQVAPEEGVRSRNTRSVATRLA
jgi:uncharacterized protein YodC (DUF2158 family)